MCTGGDDGVVRLWFVTLLPNHCGESFESDIECVKTFEGHTSSITCVKFAPDGLLMSSTSLDGTARFWEVNTFFISVILLVRKVWLRTHRAHKSRWLLNRPPCDVVAVASAFLVYNGEHGFWGRRFDADIVTFRRKNKRKSRKFLRHPIIFLVQWVYRACHKVS